MWVTPKTDWTSDDVHEYTDMQRVEGNILHVGAMTEDILGIDPLLREIAMNGYDAVPSVDVINALEENLRRIMDATDIIPPLAIKEWGDSNRVPLAEDATRWEITPEYYKGILEAISERMLRTGTFKAGNDRDSQIIRAVNVFGL